MQLPINQVLLGTSFFFILALLVVRCPRRCSTSSCRCR